MRIYYIYLITCLVNGKQYVGKTNDPKQRLIAHATAKYVSAVGRAFRKHGRENMQMEMIACALTEDAAFEAERSLIVQHGTRAPHGYNLTDGGDGTSGHTHSQETIDKMKARSFSEEHRAAISAANKRRVYRKMTAEECAANSARLKGRLISEEHRRKLGLARKRWSFTEETKEKMRVSHTARHAARRLGDALIADQLRML